METALDSSWKLLAVHRYIEVAAAVAKEEDTMDVLYQAVVNTARDPLALRNAPEGDKVGKLPRGAAWASWLSDRRDGNEH